MVICNFHIVENRFCNDGIPVNSFRSPTFAGVAIATIALSS